VPVGKLYEGQTINIAVLLGPGPQNEPFHHWKDAWERETGGKVKLFEFAFGTLYEKVMTDLMTGAGSFDGFYTPYSYHWDYIAGGYEVPIDDYIADPKFPDIGYNDILPTYRQFGKWGGKTYIIPYDGDCVIVYYRKDLLENPRHKADFKSRYGYELAPPKTWDQLLDTCEFFNGWDWDGDGKVNYGLGQTFVSWAVDWWFYPIAQQYSMLPGGPDKYRGVWYFDPETMEPLINTPGNLKAMEMFLKTKDVGPEAQLSWGIAESRGAFLTGTTAFCYEWADTGVLAQDEKFSKIKGKLGCIPVPGSYEVYDREKADWVKLTEINQFGMWTGGWGPAVSKFSKKPEATYHYFAWMGQPSISFHDVSEGYRDTGFNPCRVSHFPPEYSDGKGTGTIDGWVYGSGFNADDLKEYLTAIWKTYTAPAVWPYLRIPGSYRYGETVEIVLGEVLTGKKTPKDALTDIYDKWEKITDELGREKQIKYYRIGLGLPTS